MDQTTPASPPPSAQPSPEPSPRPSPQPSAQPSTPPHGGGFFAGVRRLGLWRSDARWIGGVAGGLAERYGLDPLLVRGIFAASALLGGVGLVAYGVGWALLPEQRDGRIHLEETLAGRFDVALLGGLAFVVVGLSRGGSGFWWGGLPGWLTAIAWIAVVAAVITVIVVAATNRRPAPRPFQPYGPPYPYPPAGAPSGAPGYAAQQPAPSAARTAAAAGGGAPGAGAPAGAYPAAGQQYPTSAYPGAHPGAVYPTGPAATYAVTAPAPYGPYPPGGGGTPPYVPNVPPAPQRPPRPPKPRRSGPGVAMVGSVVALSFLTLAGLLIAHRAGHFDEPLLLTALGISAVLAGIGIVVAGLRGRSSGALGALAIVALLVSVPVGVASTNDWRAGARHRAVAVDITPATRQVAQQGWSFGVGDTTLDLTDVPMTDGTLYVPVSVGAGDLTVIVPAEASVTADVRVGAGQILWTLEPGARQDSGLGLKDQFATQDAGSSPDIHLNVSAGAGTVRFEEQ